MKHRITPVILAILLPLFGCATLSGVPGAPQKAPQTAKKSSEAPLSEDTEELAENEEIESAGWFWDRLVVSSASPEKANEKTSAKASEKIQPSEELSASPELQPTAEDLASADLMLSYRDDLEPAIEWEVLRRGKMAENLGAANPQSGARTGAKITGTCQVRTLGTGSVSTPAVPCPLLQVALTDRNGAPILIESLRQEVFEFKLEPSNAEVAGGFYLKILTAPGMRIAPKLAGPFEAGEELVLKLEILGDAEALVQSAPSPTVL